MIVHEYCQRLSKVLDKLKQQINQRNNEINLNALNNTIIDFKIFNIHIWIQLLKIPQMYNIYPHPQAYISSLQLAQYVNNTRVNNTYVFLSIQQRITSNEPDSLRRYNIRFTPAEDHMHVANSKPSSVIRRAILNLFL